MDVQDDDQHPTPPTRTSRLDLDARLEQALDPVPEPAQSMLRDLIGELRGELEAARAEAHALRAEDEARRNSASSVGRILPPTLRNVVTIGDEPSVAAAAAVAEEAMRQLIDAEFGNAAALGIAAAGLCSVISAQIRARLDTPSVFAACDAVIAAGTADFAGVYDVMWSRIQRNEQAGMELYLRAAKCAQDLVGDATPEQHAADIATLVVQAFHARPVFEEFVRELTAPATLGFAVRTQ